MYLSYYISLGCTPTLNMPIKSIPPTYTKILISWRQFRSLLSECVQANVVWDAMASLPNSTFPVWKTKIIF